MRVQGVLGTTAVTMVGGLLLAGCTGAITPSGSGSGSGSSTAAAPSTASTGASPTPEFGLDAALPADGVGQAGANDVDEWTLANKVDNAYARVITPTGAEPLAAQAQAQVNAWLGEYRKATGTGAATPTSSPEASTGTATTATQPGGSASVSAAPTTPAEAEPDSFRVLPQLLAARADVSGVRLYGRYSTSAGVVEHWRTLWFDPSSAEVVDGTALFAEPRAGQPDPLGKARELVGAAAGNAFSDRDLFSAIAFTPSGDLVVHLPASARPAPAEPVSLSKGDLTPLLSPLGRQAQLAAADSVVRAGSGSAATTAPPGPPGPSGPSEPGTASGGEVDDTPAVTATP